MSVISNFAALDAIKIHFLSAGHEENKHKPLLICLHGFPEFSRVWRYQLDSLSTDFFVVAPDLRGYNLSDKPKDINNYRVIDLVQDIRNLVEHLNYEKLYLVGHDWGGIVAWTFATLYPELLYKLTIINSPHPRVFQKLLGTSPQQITASSYINKFLDDSAEQKLVRNDYDLLWRFGFKELVEKGVFGEDDRQAHITAWSQTGAVEAMLASYRAARFQIPNPEDLPIDFNVSDTLANHITIPTQVIWGTDDTALTIECLEGLEAYVESLTVRLVPNAGHGVIHERPNLINQYLREFFSAE